MYLLIHPCLNPSVSSVHDYHLPIWVRLRQRAKNKILSAVDRNMLFVQTEFAEFTLD